MTSRHDINILRIAKEQCCYVSLDPQKESPAEIEFRFPDHSNRHLMLKEERWMCPEALFSPRRDSLSIQELISSAIEACSVDVAPVLYNNIVLCGGTTMFRGFPSRLEKEVNRLGRTHPRFKGGPRGRILPGWHDDRQLAVWHGGKALAKLSFETGNDVWLTMKEYLENGPQRIHQKVL
eukprot:Filipodium_phascolosomae@DN1081_c0_g1_i1.p1